MSQEFTHFDDEGKARMVDVTDKSETCRCAVAFGRILISEETYSLIKSGGVKKGDVLTVAQIAGIMGAKRTSDLIPMCHPLTITGTEVRLELAEKPRSVEIMATVKNRGVTGVEMEALTAVSVAALTVYDMCKSIQKDMVITDLCLLHKDGGVNGVYDRINPI